MEGCVGLYMLTALVILLTSGAHPVQSQCCHKSFQTERTDLHVLVLGAAGVYGFLGCDDGTTGMCCGVGRCNMFCCNCDGGCR
ncbi:hypothetical protein BV898_14070 [Hypsibius exemplaris]|uniref:Uncharacterized protein n=1 Tax=Hypsibius exemplaris TaxID=2072580 RepID=A0A1W0W905_HYPEX|nr:hypothetical protein BV898_14070 [Hypsibius exemplaris]